jgi:SprT protein
MPETSTFIQPISEDQQQRVIQRTHAYIDQAGQLFDLDKYPLTISFDLKGRCAGMYRVKKSKRTFSLSSTYKREIRYNSFIFSKYFDDNYNNTIPHEVAHYVCDIVYGLKNIKPHGKEWKEIMRYFGADTSVTANYELSGIPLKKQKLFTYQCACREHQLSSIRHNKISKNLCQYLCNSCKQVIRHKQLENI